MIWPMLIADEDGAGPALILLHGFPLDRRIWLDAAAILCERFRVMIVDLPGFGQSPPIGPFTMDSLAESVHDFLKARSIDSFILGGLSMGGYVAQAYAARFADQLRGLILINTKSAADTPEAKRGRDQMIELVRANGSAAVAEQMYPKMIAPLTIQTKPGIADRVRTIMNECSPATIEHACTAMRDRPDYTAALSSYKFPTSIVTGQEDAIAPPAIATQMHASLRMGTLEIIPDAAHLSPLEQPQIFADAVTRVFANS